MNQKKIFILVIAIILISSSLIFSFSESNQKIGDVLETDIITYFNGMEVPSFNFNSKTGIYATDLRKIGLDVSWDGENRAVIISNKNDNNTQQNLSSDETTITDLGDIVYKDKIHLTITEPYTNGGLSITDLNGNNISGVSIKPDGRQMTIDKTYYLQLGESFILNIAKENGLSRYKFHIEENLTRNSFISNSYGLFLFDSVIIPANEAKGYSFPFRLMYPRESYSDGRKKYTFDDTVEELILESSNHHIDNSFEHMMMASAYRNPFNTRIVCDTDFNSFIMYGIFPRIGDAGGVYTHALDRQTVFGTEEFMDSFNRGNLYRIDIQFVNMYKESKRLLGNLGVEIDQPILSGFSAGSDFMSRLNYLHPDLGKLVIVNDPPTLPMTDYKGTKLRFPLGVGDLHEVTGEQFSKEKFLDTPQFWMTGAHDTNDGTYFADGWGSYSLWHNFNSNINRNQEGIDYRRLFGEEIISRKENIREILKAEGFNNIEYHTYDTGHSTTDQTVVDIEAFLKKHIDF